MLNPVCFKVSRLCGRFAAFFQARSFIFGCLFKVWVVAAVVIRDHAPSLADSYRFGGLREWTP